MPRGKLFDRAGESPAFEAVVSRLSASADLDAAAVGDNLAMDHRVSRQRAESFYRWAEEPSTERDLADRLADFAKDHGRLTREPDYLAPHNDSNVVRPPFDAVGIVLNISGLSISFRWGRPGDAEEMPPWPVWPQGRDFHTWLDEELSEPQNVAPFVAGTLTLLNAHAALSPFSMIWSVPWPDMVHLLNQPGERWCQALGIRLLTRGNWLIVLRVSVADLETIVRPTQLDGGWAPAHFPSPPCAALEDGGHALDLTPCSHTRVIREFIHRPPIWSDQHWRAAGERRVRVGAPFSGDLRDARVYHGKVLKERYGAAAGDWLG